MRVRPQSYLLPAALLMCLFFYTTAYSKKKNSDYGEESGRNGKFYNANYKKRAAGSDRDIISYKDTGTRGDFSQKNSTGYVYYIVRKGDTLFSIAKRSRMSLKSIQELNNINDTSVIYSGMKLKIPSDKKIVKSDKNSSSKTSISSKELLTTRVSSYSKPVFLWPLKKVKCVSRDGIDGVKSIGLIIKGNPGSDVIASENGVVKRVGYMRGYGKYIVVKHGKSYITVYSNLMDVDVKTGDIVQKGVRIGNISDDMTLHFQIDRGGKPENPLSLLPKRG